MDTETYELLSKIGLPKVTLIKLSDFEDEKLLAVKTERSKVEYYWTCTPSLPLYILKKNPNMEMVTYLDADLYFYSSPKPIYDELGDKSIIIIPHRFPKGEEWKEKTSGTYNVSMLIFRNNDKAKECLEWWRERCLEWCKATFEDGKLGDQMYLNQFPTLFSNVHVLQNIGANVAPWNIKSYSVLENKNTIYIKDSQTNKQDALIFYHFHSLPLYLNNKEKILAYPIKILEPKIYKKYLKALNQTFKKILPIEPNWAFGFDKKLDLLRLLKQYITRAWI